MEAEKDEQAAEKNNPNPDDAAQGQPRSKLPDLRPEKDPMGAGNKGASQFGADVQS